MERRYLGRPVNKEFDRLWSGIPNVYTYREYVALANEIDSARLDRLISKQEETALLGALDHWAKTMRVPTTDEEYNQMYR